MPSLLVALAFADPARSVRPVQTLPGAVRFRHGCPPEPTGPAIAQGRGATAAVHAHIRARLVFVP